MSDHESEVRITIPNPKVVAARQRFEERKAQTLAATDIRYSPRTDKVTLTMRSGIAHVIPRTMIAELEGVSPRILARELQLRVGGDAITVPSHDVDIAVSGLLRDLAGFNIQRLGGLARTPAKAAAARANGRRGGRPPSPLRT
jgi:hypothetical protein